MSNPETPLQKAIVDALRLRFPNDLEIARINCGSKGRFRGAPAGWSDIIGCVEGCHETAEGPLLDGRFVALEVKVGDAKPSKVQREFMVRVHLLGGFACVVNSVESAISAVLRAQVGESE